MVRHCRPLLRERRMTVTYRLESTHTFHSTTLEDRRFPFPADAWRAAGMDYLESDHGEGEEARDANVGALYFARHVGPLTLTTGETITVVEDCDCSEEYGPCGEHSETLIRREGASTRTADDLARTFLHDAVSVGAELSPYGRDVRNRADMALDANERLGVAWLPDDEVGAELADELQSVVWQVESAMPDGLRVYWEDGYSIVRITGGPLAEDA